MKLVFEKSLQNAHITFCAFLDYFNASWVKIQNFDAGYISCTILHRAQKHFNLGLRKYETYFLDNLDSSSMGNLLKCGC